MILLIDVELLIGELMVHNIITNSLLEILVQLIVLTDLICVLNVVLELLLVLADRCESMTYLTDDVSG